MKNFQDQCSNSKHPDGAWHMATPLPANSDTLGKLLYWWREQKHGCGCEATEDKNERKYNAS